jgi:hypothetical protein
VVALTFGVLCLQQQHPVARAQRFTINTPEGVGLLPNAVPAISPVDLEEQDGGIIKGTPHRLFEVRLAGAGRNRWVVTGDGQKFLAMVPVEQKPATTLNVVLNWPSLLRK